MSAGPSVSSRRVRAMRRRAGLTQQDFASLLGFSFVSVSRWECGHAEPGPGSSLLLGLFERGLRARGAERLVADLRRASGVPLGIVRELAEAATESEIASDLEAERGGVGARQRG